MKLINQHPITFAVYSVRDYIRSAVRDRSPFRIAVVSLGSISVAWIVHFLMGWLAQLAATIVLICGASYLFNRLVGARCDRFDSLKK